MVPPTAAELAFRERRERAALAFGPRVYAEWSREDQPFEYAEIAEEAVNLADALMARLDRDPEVGK
jgi:hypothetical protein